jgi:hypothetical protein
MPESMQHVSVYNTGLYPQLSNGTMRHIAQPRVTINATNCGDPSGSTSLMNTSAQLLPTLLEVSCKNQWVCVKHVPLHTAGLHPGGTQLWVAMYLSATFAAQQCTPAPESHMLDWWTDKQVCSATAHTFSCLERNITYIWTD